jgi:hypothetical protein
MLRIHANGTKVKAIPIKGVAFFVYNIDINIIK